MTMIVVSQFLPKGHTQVLTGTGSNGSSDSELDERMEDADDIEAEADNDGEGLGDIDDDENDGDNDNDENDVDENENENEDEEMEDAQPDEASDNKSDAPPATYADGQSDAVKEEDSAQSIQRMLHPLLRKEVIEATSYDIVPTMAAPQSTSINAVTATPDMRYWFTGGSDCYVRKYDGTSTVNGKTLLTVAQRHPFVDTVVKAGVLMSYWENEEPVSKIAGEDAGLSPVYSLAVHSEALWLLSGLESGAINLQSVRHDEGKRIAHLSKHTSAVSVLNLASDEKSVLSGSWDKNIFDWDLNNGQIKRSFTGSSGQISAIEIRPNSTLPVPRDYTEPVPASNTFSSNNADKPIPNGVLSNGVNGVKGEAEQTAAPEPTSGTPAENDSLFGGGDDNDSLFGDNDGAGAPSGGNFGADEDDEFSKAIGGIDHGGQVDDQGDNALLDATLAQTDASQDLPVPEPTEPTGSAPPATETEAAVPRSPQPLTNGLPHSEDPPYEPTNTVVDNAPQSQDALATSDTTFLSAAIDGPLRLWDRRQEQPIAHIPNRPGVPPWCMGACWSPDGNFIYAGRRNGTVEEFSLHQGLRAPERTFKFPNNSGPVSALKAMPNGRHLVWYVNRVPITFIMTTNNSTVLPTISFVCMTCNILQPTSTPKCRSSSCQDPLGRASYLHCMLIRLVDSCCLLAATEAGRAPALKFSSDTKFMRYPESVNGNCQRIIHQLADE
jgi:transcriptional activator SPT8